MRIPVLNTQRHADSERNEHTAFLLAGLCALAAGTLAARGLGLDWVSNEFAWISTGGLAEIWLSRESGFNPPLLRFLNAFLAPEETVFVGRLISLAGFAIAAAYAFLLGRAVGGADRNYVGFATVAVLLSAPVAVEHGTLFRSYAPWLGAAFAHWYYLDQVVRAPSPSGRLGLMVSTVLLPWLHYISVAMLGLEALLLIGFLGFRRDLAQCFVGSALTFIPLVIPLFSDPSGGGSPLSTMEPGLIGEVARAGTWSWTPIALFMVAIRWRAYEPVARVAALTWVGTILLIAAISMSRVVRPPAVLWVLPMAAPLLARMAVCQRRRWLGRAWSLFLILCAVGSVRTDRTRLREGAGIRYVTEHADTLLEESGGLLWVRPTGRIHWLRFARTGSLTAEGTSPCGPLCISEESGAWRAISTLPDEPGWVLDLSCYRPPELPHRCSVVSAEPCVRVARCK